jgi:hypothetical protein
MAAPSPAGLSSAIASRTWQRHHQLDSVVPSLDFKLYTLELNSLKDLIQESRATPNRCTYAVHLLEQLGEKALIDFVAEYFTPELSNQQIHH